MPTDPTKTSVSPDANSAPPESPLLPNASELPAPSPPVAGENPDFSYNAAPPSRRDFLKVAGASAGALLVGGGNLPKPKVAPAPRVPFVRAGESPDIVVVGAGAWGGWTALNLRKLGAKVTIVDAYGPGNARSTSGDETRGVRSSYGDRPGELGEVWMLWAREAMKKWIQFDDEWGRELRLNLFHVTGDLIMRSEWDNFQLRCKVWWDKNKIPYQVLNPDDVRKAFPVMSMDDITAVLYEPDAGVVRARRAAQAVSAVFEHLGGKVVIGRASPGKTVNGRLTELKLDTGATIRGDTFVYAVGPWLGKTFPEIFAKKTRVPMGYVCYFATPIGDYRFTYPNIPSYNFPGVTGWAALPVDNRGFRVRGGERAPDQVVAADGRGGGRGTPANGANAAAGSGISNASVAAAAPQGAASGAGASATNADGRGGAGGRGGRGGGGGRNGNAAGGQRGGGGFGNLQDVPPQQQDPDTSDRWANQSQIDGPRRFVAHRFPLLKDAPIAQTHSCHYESTSSGNFIFDHHPGWNNVWIAAGGNAEGFKMGPKVGDYMSKRVLGYQDPQDKLFTIPEKDFEPPPTPADSTKKAAADSAAKPVPPGGKPPGLR
ncbi:MAG TPA: FAD-dependent oxidoreductase [Gemmatimonadaceae bacterium]|jgi:glycine/D-amino acid oxidase-like deaminating enzyme|nr:FAD-dependent oxidoreductase [Gemmatimonadaceae bacterium]